MATVLIPTPLRKFTGNLSKIQVDGQDISQAFVSLVASHPSLQNQIFDAQGNIRSFINVFVDQDDIRNLEKNETAILSHSVISIVPAIAGG